MPPSGVMGFVNRGMGDFCIALAQVRSTRGLGDRSNTHPFAANDHGLFTRDPGSNDH